MNTYSVPQLGDESGPNPTSSPRLNAAIVAFPLLVSIRQGTVVSLACLFILLFLSTLGRHRPATRATAYLPFISLCLSAAVVLLRSAPRGEVILLAGGAVVAFTAARRCPPMVALRSMTTGVAVYLIANIAGWLGGLQSPGQAVRVGLYDTSDSLFADRVFFPFSRSINEPPVVAAAFFAFCVVSWRTNRGALTRIERLGFVASIFVVAASGSRSPAAMAAIIAGMLVLVPALSRLVALLSLSFMGLPFFVVGLGSIISYLASNLSSISFLSRGQSALQLENFSSRGIFWERGIDFWSSVSGLQRPFGFGYNGHVTSEVVFTYYTDGGFVNSPAALTLHNSLLQQLYDGGYFGVATLVLGLFFTARILVNTKDHAIVAFVSVLMASCALEAYMDIAFRTTPALLVLLLSAIVAQVDATPRGGLEHRKDNLNMGPQSLGGLRTSATT